MEERFLKLFQETLEKDDDSVNVEDEFRNLEEWDSLAVLSILAMINEEYDVTIPRTDFDKLKTIQDLYSYIVQKSKQ
jgi:acyl carrier protein